MDSLTMREWLFAGLFFLLLFAGLLYRRTRRWRQLQQKTQLAEKKKSIEVAAVASQSEADKIVPQESQAPADKSSSLDSAPRKSGFGKAIASWIPLLKEKTKDRDRWEEVLIGSDMGPKLVDRLLDDLQSSEQDPEDFFKLKLKTLLRPAKAESKQWTSKKPWVLYVVGVNGVGKTTSLVKLGRFMKEKGLSVGVVGADTFRKAAIEQLERQCDSNSLSFFTQRLEGAKVEGADPSSVIFDGLQHFKNQDVILVDTSGRLHNKKNLMEELRKMKRVGAKVIPDAPHDVWLVLDATLGQNALSQAEMFHEAVTLTGLILTKMDGLSRGGIIFQIFQKIQCPIWFMGVGESSSDLEVFDPENFVDSLFEHAG